MNILMKKYFFSAFLVLVFIFTASFVATPSVFADNHSTSSGDLNNPTNNRTSSGTLNQPGSQMQLNVKVDNPIGSVNTVDDLISQIIRLALLVGVPILVLVFIWIGFMFVKAQGNETKLKEAKQALWWAIVGAFLLLGASVLGEAIRETVDQLK